MSVNFHEHPLYWRGRECPGGYAHVTMVAYVRERIETLPHLTDDDRYAIEGFPEYCDLGVVGPDYPYLGGSADWANKMHYNVTAEPIRVGLRVLRSTPNGDSRLRSLAWLFGYAAHVAGDLTIHPVVEAKVGNYADHKPEHRQCEMHQDSWVWQKRGMDEIGVADFFNPTIDACSESNGRLHRNVTTLWRKMLQTCYPDLFESSPPNCNEWHQGYRRVMNMVEESHRLPGFMRHTLAGEGAAYPKFAEIDPQFIERLETPNGFLHYDAILELAVQNIGKTWSLMAEALNAVDDQAAETALARLPDGDLDTGRLLADRQHYVFWA